MSNFELRDFYIPPHSLNKEEFPGHILWKGDCNSILLKFNQSIKCINAYNASRKEDEKLGTVLLSDFEVPGYVGLDFIADLDSDVNAYLEVSCEFYGVQSNLLLKSKKTIQIFRPSLVVANDDDNEERKPIEIELNPRTLKYKIQNKIQVSNVGKGTALIMLDLESEDGSIEMTLPPRFLEFYASFFEDLKLRFRELSRNFREKGYSKIIWQFYRVQLNFPLLMKEGKTEIIDDAQEAMNGIIQKDYSFGEEYQKSTLASKLNLFLP